MVNAQFHSCSLLVDRARRHIEELAAQEHAFNESKPFELFEEQDLLGRQVFLIRAVKHPPLTLAPIINDILGGLRSSLDHAVCTAATAAGVTDLRDLSFHFADSEAHWNRSLKGHVRGVPADVVSIMRAYRPYKGGNDLLYSLNHLARNSKHRQPTAVALFTDETFQVVVTALADNSEFYFTMDSKWDFKKRQRKLAYTRHGRIKISEPQVNASFVFGKLDDLAGGKAIVPVLLAMADLCAEIIHVMASASGTPGH